MIFKNRKGISFVIVAFITAVVMFALTVLLWFSPLDDMKDRFSLDEKLPAVDYLNKVEIYQDLVLENTLSSGLEYSLKSFPSKFASYQNNNVIVSTDELLGCQVVSPYVQLWYNEINAKASKDKGGENCLPEFSNLGEDFLKNYVEESLSVDVEKLLGPTKYRNLFAEVNRDADNDVLDMGLVVANKVTGPTFSAEKKVSAQFAVSDKELFDLLFAVEKVLPQVSDKLKSEVPSYLSQNSGASVEEAIVEIVLKELEKESPEAFKNYDLSISFIEGIAGKTDGKFFGLKFDVKKAGEGETSFEFGGIFEYNIPLASVDFAVSTYESLPNTIELKVKKPANSDEVNNFVILYSYENFFDSSFSGHESFRTLIENGEIPSKFNDQLGVEDKFGRYYYSDESLGFKLDLLAVDAKFSEGESEKKVLIYQKYDYENNEYELLESGRDVYVYVFAVDDKYNYDVNEVKVSNVKTAQAANVAPRPIPKLDLSTGNPASFSLSSDKDLSVSNFAVEVSNYADSNFDHYDVYLVEDGQEDLKENCLGMSSDCYYFDGTYTMNVENGKFLFIESDSQGMLSNTENYMGIDYHTNFRDSSGNAVTLDFDSLQGYSVYVIPKSAEGDVALNGMLVSDSIEDAGNYYRLKSDGKKNFLFPLSRTFGGGDLASSSTSSLEPAKEGDITFGEVGKNEEGLFLPFSSEKYDIVSLSLILDVYKPDGTLYQQNYIGNVMGEDLGYKLLVGNYDEFGSFEVKKIIPRTAEGPIEVEFPVSILWVNS